MSIALTILGIGLLLLIHEGGHYFAARAVGINVKVFALGFGPRLIGWRRNGTDFRISLLPLGGYVQVSGDDPNRPPRPGDLFYASAAQRLLFYSGGIIANLAFAFIFIPILFSIGVPFVSPTIGNVVDKSPAWEAGIQPGDLITQVGDREVHGFRHISSAIALAPQNGQIQIDFMRDGERQSTYIAPEYDSGRGFSTIGIGPAYSLSLSKNSGLHQQLGDYQQVIAFNGHRLDSTLSTQLALDSLSRSTSTFNLLAINDDGDEKYFEFNCNDYLKQQSTVSQLGVNPLAQQVGSVRGELAAIFKEGDLIVALNGGSIFSKSQFVAAVALNSGSNLKVDFIRSGENFTSELPPLSAAQANSNISFDTNDELAFFVHPLSAGYKSGMRSGTKILRANNVAIQKMDDLRNVIVNNPKGQEIEFQILSGDGEKVKSLAVTPAPVPQLDIGLQLSTLPKTVLARNPLQAIKLGYREAIAMVSEVGTTAKRLITGEVDSKNMGGIISIGVMTNNFATQGLSALLFFLCLISVNLAVLNFLPIPALDGGHILFALYEIITRRKVSTTVQNAFQLVGVLLVLGMLVFVTTNDIQRLIN
ncbi:MAG: site-2 protease family protein [Planctomycetota bacterium]|jgi:regulator of sigma E protease|nr:site-2 protease family protein [Planctomycetota bacterium]